MSVDLQEVVIREAKPPMFDVVCAVFGITEKELLDRDVIFAYKNEVWNPTGSYVGADRIVHEAVHFKQHENYKNGCDGWWWRYLVDAPFRLEQEVEAYQAQYWWAREALRDRNTAAKLLDFIAKALSSEMYGNIITYQEAVRRIKS